MTRPPQNRVERSSGATIAQKYVVELQERVKPVLVQRKRRNEQFVNPAHAGFALVLPSLDRIYIEQVPIRLAVSDKKIVFAGKSDLAQAGICVNQLSGDVSIQKPSLPALLKSKSWSWLKSDQINVSNLLKNVLCFVKSALEEPPREAPGRRNANAW